MAKKINIALLITLIAVLLTVWNTVLTLHVCARLDGGEWRIDHIEAGFSRIINTLQTIDTRGELIWKKP